MGRAYATGWPVSVAPSTSVDRVVADHPGGMHQV